MKGKWTNEALEKVIEVVEGGDAFIEGVK